MQHSGSSTTRLRSVEYPMEVLGIPKWKAYDLARRGILPSVKVGRLYRFDPERLERWIAEGGTGLDVQ